MTLHAVEVGSRGYISPQNKDHLKKIFKDLSKKEITNLNQEMAQKHLLLVSLYFTQNTARSGAAVQICRLNSK